MDTERRKFKRKEVPGFAFISIDTEGVAQTDNLSEGGMQINLPVDFLERSIFKIRVVLADETVLELKGYVSRVENIQGELKLAVEFIELTDEQRKAINESVKHFRLP